MQRSSFRDDDDDVLFGVSYIEYKNNDIKQVEPK